MKIGYWRRIGSCVSQFFNVLILNGYPDESLSARAYRTKSRWEYWINKVFGKGHCERAYNTDIAHAKDILGV